MSILKIVFTGAFATAILYSAYHGEPVFAAEAPLFANQLDPAPSNTLLIVKSLWAEHRNTVQSISNAVATAREDIWLSVFGFILFVVIIFPRDIKGIRQYFHSMMEKHPLPAYRQGGVTDELIATTRKVLFFFTLFLLYQLFEFALTFGNNDVVPFYADLFFQSAIVLMLAVEYTKLRRAIRKRWKGNAEKKKKISAWLDDKLEGLNIRKLTIAIFIVGFTPVFLANLYSWTDNFLGSDVKTTAQLQPKSELLEKHHTVSTAHRPVD